MVAMTVSVPVGTESSELITEVLAGFRTRLSDQYGYEATSSTTPTAEGVNYVISPRPDIEVIDRGTAVVFKLYGFHGVDEGDLLAGVSSSLEQRHDGAQVKIG
jgi:hypothetical protein